MQGGEAEGLKVFKSKLDNFFTVNGKTTDSKKSALFSHPFVVKPLKAAV